MKYSLQYASNLFLNLQKKKYFQTILKPCSENLALLGNISSLDTEKSIDIYREFLTYISYNWNQVYLIPGPYEYSSIKPKNYKVCLNELYTLKESYSNIKILNNTHYVIPNTDIQLIGSTLWSKHPYMKHQCLYEYNNIWLRRHSSLGQLMGYDILNWNSEDIDYINNTIKNNYRSIVLSHHLPHKILNTCHIRSKLDSSNFEHMLRKPIEIWLSGAGDTSMSHHLGYSSDVFCSTNPFTTFNNVNNNSYNPKALINLRLNENQLV
uniref:Calcineurin-like phosphoesterase domain-containing protein n=1 Tax=viral metagenome TaxID=1070528 RepID=A0A6C0IEA3_9ZZZZ